MQAITTLNAASGYATKHQGSVIRIRGLFNGTAANRYLLFFDVNGYLVPPNGTAPTIPAIVLYQGAAGAPTAFFQEYEIGYLEAVNGVYWAVSTTQETLTLSTDTVDISVELSDAESPASTTYVGNAVTAVDTLTVYASNPAFALVNINVTNTSAGLLYLQLYASSIFRTGPPFMVWPVAAGATLALNFGRQGLKLVQGPSGGSSQGCILYGSTTPNVYTPTTGGQWTMEAEHI